MEEDDSDDNAGGDEAEGAPGDSDEFGSSGDEFGNFDSGSELPEPPEPEQFSIPDEGRSQRATGTDENTSLGDRATGIAEMQQPGPLAVCKERSFADQLLSKDSVLGGKTPHSNDSKPGERATEWVGKDAWYDVSELAKAVVDYVKDCVGGAEDFVNNYNEMKSANVRGADKYFHCMANCQATERGVGGEHIAIAISYGREASDMVRNPIEKGLSVQDSLKDARGDLEANRIGREGAGTGVRCYEACHQFRPRGL